ncbi:MAG TPA: response regulator [Symbiobacteriaceae bacterium]|jgi:DNA-binding response OmpR family regulator|nr:response regulator [Symbiobacteriaceae bacterium]
MKSILVVDDEKNIRLTLGQALETAGYSVAVAIDGEHGLAKAQEISPHLVLLDMKLPGMDGIEVLRRLRTTNPNVPVVMITAHGTVETAVEAMKLGAVDYLRKPFTPEEIRALVSKVLDRQTLETERPADSVDACLEQAKLLLTRREFDAAEHMLRQAASLDPSHVEALNLTGVLLELKGRLDEGARYYRAALSFEPSYTPAIDNLHRIAHWPYRSTGIEQNLQPKQITEGN